MTHGNPKEKRAQDESRNMGGETDTTQIKTLRKAQEPRRFALQHQAQGHAHRDRVEEFFADVMLQGTVKRQMPTQAGLEHDAPGMKAA